MSHRFVTVRRGSPAARSGQIQPGDQLEAVEGRSVSALQHRDLAQILRRAGNTLRLSITPRHHSSDGADLDIDGRLMKGSRGRSKDESRFYSVDLERGPTGFGFSLRGGSEYNMGLYVLGLMDGGPAQRSNKIQLVEINGESTSGMTHSQAVEQIRRGGHRIHLVLKKGNGYVPDYGPEEGALSPSSSSYNEEQSMDAVTMTTASLSLQREEEGVGGEERRRTREGGERPKKRGGSSTGGETKPKAGGRGGRGGRGGQGGRGGAGTPDLDLDAVDEETHEEERERQRKEEEDEDRRRQEEERSRRRGEEEEEKKRKQTSQSARQKEKQSNQRKSRSSPGARAQEDKGEESEGARERSQKKSRRRGREWEKRQRVQEVQEVQEAQTRRATHSGTSASASNQRAPFSFLMPLDDHNDHSRGSDSESVASFSEVSLSAASIATTGWRDDSDWRSDESSQQHGEVPGPWLKPSSQRLTRVLIGSRLREQELTGGLAL
ncbi:uncharacterized protein LOC142988114 isoform X2 [Genypterus blacodes]|uniref:uncharacterized protein LOC142988114 isoform X2 n=1 Tax=Genypterus blacodes TaxID=154954 RepID=UPI003F75D428